VEEGVVAVNHRWVTTTMTIRIDIYYQTRDSESPVHVALTPETYFDALEPDQTYAADGIPRFNFTWQYLDVKRDGLIWSIERRSGTNGDDTTLSTQYFDSGKTSITHCSDPDGYEELIHAINLGDSSYLTARTFKQPGGRWVGHMFLTSDTSDKELYSLFPARRHI
jgi:hypothetical protein